jgi:hypothetical protein
LPGIWAAPHRSAEKLTGGLGGGINARRSLDDVDSSVDVGLRVVGTDLDVLQRSGSEQEVDLLHLLDAGMTSPVDDGPGQQQIEGPGTAGKISGKNFGKVGGDGGSEEQL